MKKLFNLCIMIATFFGTIAQVPNPGFENWTGTPPNENPVGWWTINMLVPAGGVSKTTDAHSGNYAANLQVITLGGPTNFPGLMALNNPTNDATASGIPFTGMPDTLKVWLKYNTTGNDQVLVALLLTAWDAVGDSAIPVGGGGGFLTGSQPNFIEAVLPIEYDTLITPDSMQIIIAVGDVQAPTPTGTLGSYVIVDDISLVGGGPPVKVNDLILANKVKVYPNPNNGNFNVDIPADFNNATLNMFDLNGKNLLSKYVNSGVLQLNTSNASGKYIIKIQNDKHTVNKNVIIE
jgi:hypothetical protein